MKLSAVGQALEGDGVVGKFPRLSTGETFSYNSYHVIGADSIAYCSTFMPLPQRTLPISTASSGQYWHTPSPAR